MTSEALGEHGVRVPAVAGFFYPNERERLESDVRLLLSASDIPTASTPRALIAPHAGYQYSGVVAASAFGHLASSRTDIDVVFLLGPAHRVPVAGAALPRARTFRTPLGDVPVASSICAELLEEDWIVESEKAHAQEHSLEVQLPFLQMALPGGFRVVPLVIGGASPEQVARIIERYWEVSGVLFVVSSDLSHFLDYETGRRKDAETMERIVSLRAPDLSGEDACGHRAVNGLIEFGARRNLRPKSLCLESSGDHNGGRSRVVGYGAIGFWENTTGV